MLSRVIIFMRRPVSWAAVFLSYAGVIAAVSYAAASGAASQDAVRMEARERAAALAVETRSRAAVLEQEAIVRERDICHVIINVHTNAVFRYRTERQSLHGAKEYVRTGEDPDLRRRIRANLPITRRRVRDAKNNVRATAVPPTCKPYQ